MIFRNREKETGGKSGKGRAESKRGEENWNRVEDKRRVSGN